MLRSLAWRLTLITCAAGFGLAVPTLAREEGTTVTVSILPGPLTVTVTGVILPDVTFSATEDQTISGTFTLTVDDCRGSGAGWNVTVQSGQLIGPDDTIDAANVSLTRANAPITLAGQPIDPEHGPKATTRLGSSLDTPVGVVMAAAEHGQGRYQQVLGFTVTVPAGTAAGSYAFTPLVTAASAPGF